jgi:hypothetical protein
MPRRRGRSWRYVIVPCFSYYLLLTPSYPICLFLSEYETNDEAIGAREIPQVGIETGRDGRRLWCWHAVKVTLRLSLLGPGFSWAWKMFDCSYDGMLLVLIVRAVTWAECCKVELRGLLIVDRVCGVRMVMM